MRPFHCCLLAGYVLLAAAGLTCAAPGKAPEQANAIPQAEGRVIALVRHILDDPMMVPGLRGARLIRMADKEDPEDELLHLHRRDARYHVLREGAWDDQSVDSIFLFSRVPGTYDLAINLAIETRDSGARPTSGQQDAALNFFVARYWPGLIRVQNHESPSGVASYALLEEGVPVFEVRLDYRSDGRIFKVDTRDMRPLLAGRRILLAPLPDRFLAAAVEAGRQWHSFPVFVDLQVVSSWRSVEAMPGLPVVLSDHFKLRGKTLEGKTCAVIGSYDEAIDRARIEQVLTEENETPQEGLAQMAEDEREIGEMADTAPVWSQSGDRLFFFTTRPTLAESPWARAHTVGITSLVTCRVEEGKARSLQAIQLIKPFIYDWGTSGDRAWPSPSGRFVALGDSQRLLVCDLQRGVTYQAHIYNNWKPTTRRWLPVAKEVEPKTPGQITSLTWLPDEHGFVVDGHPWCCVLSWQGEAIDALNERYLTELPKGVFHFATFDGGRGVSYAQANEGGSKWYFTIADRDPKTSKTKLRHRLELTGSPATIVHDALRHRCLVFENMGAYFWLQVVKGKLVKQPVPPLKWGEYSVIVNTAAINPRTGQIILAASGDAAVVLPGQKKTAEKLLFCWDGKSDQVTPLIQPAALKIPWRNFPATNSPSPLFVANLEGNELKDSIDRAHARDTAQRPFLDVVHSALRHPYGSVDTRTFSSPIDRARLASLRSLLSGDMQGLTHLVKEAAPTADEWLAAIPVLRAQGFGSAANAMSAFYNLGRVSWRLNSTAMLKQGLRDWAQLPASARESLTSFLLDLTIKDALWRQAVSRTALDMAIASPKNTGNEYFTLALRLGGKSSFSEVDVRELVQIGRTDYVRRLSAVVGR